MRAPQPPVNFLPYVEYSFRHVPSSFTLPVFPRLCLHRRVAICMAISHNNSQCVANLVWIHPHILQMILPTLLDREPNHRGPSMLYRRAFRMTAAAFYSI